MSGYFVLRRKCISDINFNRPVSSLLLDILARGHVNFVAEVWFKCAARRQGKKEKANLMTAAHYFSPLWQLTFKSDFGFE